MATVHQILLREWESCGPDDLDGALAGSGFGHNELARQLASELSSAGRLGVQELARGLHFEASSFVGRIRLGEWEVTIQPKIPAAPLLTLLRYVYGLRHLEQYEPTGYATNGESFQDLLIQQLVTEASELLARGLHRGYIRREENLAVPRGRINFQRYAYTAGLARVALPCVYHSRSEDTLLNRTLLAGLRMARHLTADLDLRAMLGRLAKTLEGGVSSMMLDLHVLTLASRAVDRRTSRYVPALTLIKLLLSAQGIVLDEKPTRTVPLPGFLFDMNRFFQALLSRFLHEHLEGCEVSEEHRLKGMFSYDPQRNPRNWRSPVLRPDFVVRLGMNIVAVLDAKYRDLWERRLPREMLYQLTLYALWPNNAQRRSTILYPTMAESATEQVLHFNDPMMGVREAEVIMRPVHLPTLAGVIEMPSDPASRRRKVSLARMLAFGSL